MVRRAGSDALSMSLRSTAPVGSSAASIRRRNRPNTAFRFRGCFDMRNPLQHNPGPRGPGRTDGDRGRRGRRRQAADAGSEAPTDHGGGRLGHSGQHRRPRATLIGNEQRTCLRSGGAVPGGTACQRVLRQARSGQLDEDRLLPGQDKRERDLTKKLDKLAAQAGGG